MLFMLFLLFYIIKSITYKRALFFLRADFSALFCPQNYARRQKTNDLMQKKEQIFEKEQILIF